MKIQLDVMNGGRKNLSSKFDSDIITIGREHEPGKKSNDLDFHHSADIKVSRTHAEIIKAESGFTLKEKNGKGNTFVNGIAVKEKLLRDNDIIMFGKGGPEVRVRIPSGEGRPTDRVSGAGAVLSTAAPFEKKGGIGRRTLLEVMGLQKQEFNNKIVKVNKRARTAVVLSFLGIAAVMCLGIAGFKYYNRLAQTDRMITLCIEQGDRALAAQISELVKKGELSEEKIARLRAEYALLKRSLPAMNPVIREVQKAVVRVSVAYDIIESGTEKIAVYRGKPCRFSIQGSGFCVKENGYIVTNAHVVSPWLFHSDLASKKLGGKRRTLTVTFDGESRPHSAEIVALDKGADLALVKIDGSGFPSLKFNAGLPGAGDSVAILGFPSVIQDLASEASCIVIGGNISKVETDGNVLYSMITSDGNSGGPVISSAGQVVAVHSSGLYYDGTGFFVCQGSEEMMSLSDQESGSVIRDAGQTVEINDLGTLGGRKGANAPRI